MVSEGCRLPNSVKPASKRKRKSNLEPALLETLTKRDGNKKRDDKADYEQYDYQSEHVFKMLECWVGFIVKGERRMEVIERRIKVVAH